ncbi:hypothetical protein HUN39_18530 [Methylocystis sp. FS]|uniref:hypothetical protein n=1 Tax=Methylocystis silviterrae TaxID=2743612 RepID=UPI0015831196|nr:hypothetical protein [Methylocystis silviterrae]NUJ81985.1 hypothetical protein [Methylocystis silviterrae]
MKDFYEAIVRYEEYRSAAYQFSEEALKRNIRVNPAYISLTGIAIQLAPISDAAIRCWRDDANDPIYPWDELKSQFRPYINRFELAIWGNGRVCGMAYGRPSKGPSNLTIHFAERWMSDSNPLKGFIAPTIADVANAYAIILEKRFLRIKDPVEDAIPAYLSLGFHHAEPIGRVSYMERRVTT